ncbi:SH3 domain-containing protein [Novosphingobium aquimarinum]|uniref:SH3 domain-containing protein n=1 Tax=Novosphingobium aquimarinum TaxID=2682494 RepID=UPI002FC3083A
MSGNDSYLRAYSAGGMLSLSGPSPCAGRDSLPVRGDLAHIRLAGQCFVPHYAVPMPHSARAGAVLLREEHDEAEILAVLAQGARFDVLDISGDWAWGQAEADGLVGYVALSALEPILS